MATYSESEAGATESVVYYYQQYAEVGSIYAVTKPMVEDAAKTVGRDFAINKTSEVVANIAYPYNEENRETTEKRSGRGFGSRRSCPRDIGTSEEVVRW